MPQRILVLPYVVLPRGIQHAAETVRHFILGLTFVDHVVWVNNSRDSVELVGHSAELTLDYLAIYEHLLVVLVQVIVKIDRDVSVLNNLLNGERSEVAPHLDALHLLLLVNLWQFGKKSLDLLLLE